MSVLSNRQSEQLIDIVHKNYENRNASEHVLLCDMMQGFFPTMTAKAIRMMSFFITSIKGPLILTVKQFTAQSFVFLGVCSNNPEQPIQMKMLIKDAKITVDSDQQILFLDYNNYLNSCVLGESSIEQQINFMHSSEFLCSVPRKRLYYLLKNCKIMTFTTSQCVYYEGQRLQAGESGSGAYFVRKGDFGYFKNAEKQSKELQVLRFTKGHLFGTLELGQNSPKRVFTVRCKTYHSIIFNFTTEIFTNHIKPYCENFINQKQSKLNKYMEKNYQKSNAIRNQKANLLSQTLTRRFSVPTAYNSSKNFNSNGSQLPMLNRTKMSTVRPMYQQSRLKLTGSQQLQNQALKKSTGLSLMKDGPLNKYPLASTRSSFTDTQFRDFVKLQRRKQQAQKIKKLQTRNCSSNRGQILFHFFKQTWMFDKQKKLKNTRYQ